MPILGHLSSKDAYDKLSALFDWATEEVVPGIEELGYDPVVDDPIKGLYDLAVPRQRWEVVAELATGPLPFTAGLRGLKGLKRLAVPTDDQLGFLKRALGDYDPLSHGVRSPKKGMNKKALNEAVEKQKTELDPELIRKREEAKDRIRKFAPSPEAEKVIGEVVPLREANILPARKPKSAAQRIKAEKARIEADKRNLLNAARRKPRGEAHWSEKYGPEGELQLEIAAELDEMIHELRKTGRTEKKIPFSIVDRKMQDAYVRHQSRNPKVFVDDRPALPPSRFGADFTREGRKTVGNKPDRVILENQPRIEAGYGHGNPPIEGAPFGGPSDRQIGVVPSQKKISVDLPPEEVDINFLYRLRDDYMHEGMKNIDMAERIDAAGGWKQYNELRNQTMGESYNVTTVDNLKQRTELSEKDIAKGRKTGRRPNQKITIRRTRGMGHEELRNLRNQMRDAGDNYSEFAAKPSKKYAIGDELVEAPYEKGDAALPGINPRGRMSERVTSKQGHTVDVPVDRQDPGRLVGGRGIPSAGQPAKGDLTTWVTDKNTIGKRWDTHGVDVAKEDFARAHEVWQETVAKLDERVADVTAELEELYKVREITPAYSISEIDDAILEGEKLKRELGIQLDMTRRAKATRGLSYESDAFNKDWGEAISEGD